MNAKHNHRINQNHLSRLAVVYVRQSSQDQVRTHKESLALQLGLRERALEWGWAQPILIDDDLGVSAGGFANRPGFEKVLSLVVQRDVGIILSVDVSRLSRNSRDWAYLLELCGHFHTLIADTEQVYDLSKPNDRLLLGIKGTISEMELNTQRMRLQAGLEAKAARGELRLNLPSGYVYDSLDKMVMDPDRRVQAAINQMFEQFDRCTSIRQLALWYRDTKTLFPVKKIQINSVIHWEIPTSSTFRKLLIHPIYAGAYVFGRRVTTVECVDGSLLKRQSKYLPPEECRVCIRDHHPAYISWDRLQANLKRIAENRPRWTMQQNRGAIRDGLALLSGLLRCGQCGGKIYVSYAKKSALYSCDGGHVKNSRRCLCFGSHLIDKRVGEELCRAVEPLAVEAALTAVEEKECRRRQQIESARMRVKAAEYEADRTFEQYNLSDPKNRLVTASLEERLNEKLAEVQAAKRELIKREEGEREISNEQRQRLNQMAQDFPQVWNHSEAPPSLKKRLLRAAITEILVTHDSEHQRLNVVIHWQGGAHSNIHVPKHPRPKGTRRTDPSLVELVRQLAEHVNDAQAARILNMKNLETPRGKKWTQERVKVFRVKHGISQKTLTTVSNGLTQNQAATYLGISRNTLNVIAERGLITTNQVTSFAPWRVPCEQLDSEPVQSLVQALKRTGRLPKGGCSKGQKLIFDEQ